MSKYQPLISVVIPTYNGARHIKKAIESVRIQSYKKIEIIIIDDGSKDETPGIISEFKKKDSRVIIVTNKTNLGFVRTLNKGIKIAQGKYIARLDDDDIWIDPKKIKKQVEFLEKHRDYVLVGGGMIKIDEKNREIARYLFPEKDEDIRESILIDNLFIHSTVLFRKDAWEKVGGYDEQFGFFADMDLWLKLGKIGKFHNFQEYLVYYLDKELSNNYSMRNRDIRRRVGAFIRLRKKHRNDYPGYEKAFLLSWISYFYSFLPFRKELRPILLKSRTLIIGPPAYIVRRLPNPIKNLLSWLYNKWNTKIDEETIDRLEEYFYLDRKKVIRLLKLGGQLNADLWRCLNPKTEKEIKKFYEDTPFYIFHLVFWHSTRYQRALRLKIIELSKGKVLDYGGGIGDLSAELAKKGFNVDYVDLPGRTFNFAKWFFQKNKCNVKMIDLNKKKISKKYDTILCIDVIEHVSTPKELLKDLANHLRINGRLIITALHPNISEETPMHLEIKFDPEKYLNSLGIIKAEEPFLWVKKS